MKTHKLLIKILLLHGNAVSIDTLELYCILVETIVVSLNPHVPSLGSFLKAETMSFVIYESLMSAHRPDIW